MQHTRPEDFFYAMAAAYEERDYESVAACYDTPGALYLEEDMVVWENTGSLIRTLKDHCATNYALGTRHAVPTVVAQSFHGKRQLSVWVRWSFLGGDGTELFDSLIRYFCRSARDGTLSIQLVELPERPAAWAAIEAPAPFCRIAEKVH